MPPLRLSSLGLSARWIGILNIGRQIPRFSCIGIRASNPAGVLEITRLPTATRLRPSLCRTLNAAYIGHVCFEVVSEGDESPVQIAFNGKYLADVLAVLDSQGLKMELSEPLRPGVIRPTDSTDYLCVLMPMQVV